MRSISLHLLRDSGPLTECAMMQLETPRIYPHRNTDTQDPFQQL